MNKKRNPTIENASDLKNNQKSTSKIISSGTLENYRASTRTYINGATDRLKDLSRPGTIEDLYDQMMILHAISKAATINRYRSSIKHIFTSILEDGEIKSSPSTTRICVALEEALEMHIPEWAENLTKQDIEDYISWMSLGRKSLIAKEGWRADKALQEWREVSGEVEEITGDDDALKRLSGLKTSSKSTAKKKSWSPITRQILTRIDLSLTGGIDARAILRAIQQNRRIDLQTMARISMWGCWLTGMRPAEAEDAVLLLPTRQGPPIESEVMDFEEMSQNGYNTAEESLAENGKTIDAALDLISSIKMSVDKPILFRIRNLKTANAPDAVPYRFIDVTQLPDVDLVRLLHVSLLRHTKNVEGENANWVGTVGSLIKDASSKPMIGLKGTHLTLGLLRHNFIETARASKTTAEVSAIVGHTSLRTTRGYGSGEAHLFRYASGGGLPIIPAADPMRADTLKSNWNEKAKLTQERVALRKQEAKPSIPQETDLNAEKDIPDASL